MSNRPTLQGGGLITLDWLRLAETRCSSGRDPKRHPVSLPTFCAHPPVNRQSRLMTAGQRVEIHRLQSQVNNDDNSFHEGWGAVRFGRGWWQGSRAAVSHPAARPGAASFPVLSYSWTAAQLSFLTPGPAVTSRGGESEKKHTQAVLKLQLSRLFREREKKKGQASQIGDLDMRLFSILSLKLQALGASVPHTSLNSAFKAPVAPV